MVSFFYLIEGSTGQSPDGDNGITHKRRSRYSEKPPGFAMTDSLFFNCHFEERT